MIQNSSVDSRKSNLDSAVKHGKDAQIFGVHGESEKSEKFGKIGKFSVILMFGLAVGSCTSFSTEPTRFYSLNASIAKQISVDQTQNISIGIGPLDFPELLDRPQIITRTDGHAIKRSELHYWGGSLESEFIQVLADNLQAQLRTNQVLVYPWDNRHRPNYQLRGAITRFDGLLGGKVYLQARWQLMSFGKKSKLEIIRNSHIEQQTEDPTYNAYVSALSQTIASLGEEIASCVETPEKCQAGVDSSQ